MTMLFAKTAPPLAMPVGLQLPIFDRAANSRLTLFTSPAGFFCSGHLTATLNDHSRPTVWLRLGPEDADPATLLLSVISAARRLQPEVGAVTLERMRRHPGPMAGWVPLFSCLGHELAEALPTATVLVLEHLDQIGEAHPTLELLGANLLAALPASIACILTAHTKVPTSGWPSYLMYRGPDDLRVDNRLASRLVRCSTGRLPGETLERAVTLTEGRADVLAGLCTVADESDAVLVRQGIDRAATLDDLLFRIAHAWLAAANANGLQSLALALATQVEYSHPSLIQATLGSVSLPPSPLLQTLGDDWTRVHCAWKWPLHTALQQNVQLSQAALRRMADYLASHDALEQGVALYLEMGDMGGAAQAIAKAAERMIDLGQWQTLSSWLNRLARPAIQRAEATGTLKSNGFWKRLTGALGWPPRSPSLNDLAEGYPSSQSSLSPAMLETVREAQLEWSEMGEAGQGSEVLSEAVNVAIPGTEFDQERPSTPQANLSDFEGALLAQAADVVQTPALLEEGIPTPVASAPLSPPSESIPAVDTFTVAPDLLPSRPASSVAQAAALPDLLTAPAQVPILTAHLLGPFRVAVNDRPVEYWPAGRAQGVFKYLLMHHSQPVLRDVLMDIFWPDVSPEVVRNRLHVALSGLRQKLRTVTDRPIVIFDDGAYRLAPNVRLWVDVDEFGRHVEKGDRLEMAGQTAKAAAEFELAISLYQGDLLADDPYEEWPVLMRERLRVAYLDSLDHLSHIYFGRAEYAACETLCHLILARDNCREDAHRLLMRCYSRLGQDHLALRQYQVCVKALRTELDVEPAPATRQLADHIRRHEIT
jgi:DNA-binding SARP family transcriptional activator